MRAVRYYGPGDVRLDEVPEPTPKAQQVKIKILPVSPTATKPHAVTQEKLPVIMGHEFSDLVYPLPPGVPLDVGALMEPLAVAWHAVKRSNIKADDSVLVLGAGPIGLLTLRVARAFGAAWVGVSEPALKRRELALKNGASSVFDPTAQGTDVVAEAARVTAGRGVDIVLDCAGTQKTLDTAFLAVKPRGHIVNIAVWEKRPLLDIDSLTYKEVILTSVLAYDRVHADMLHAIAEGKFNVDGLASLITRRISLQDVVDKGIKALIHEKDEHVKILVSPDLKSQALLARL
ncbi:NAD(P)-binding protein [Trametes cingulata]|nr:NAD(P)-binding protein [Trametes cingulata]